MSSPALRFRPAWLPTVAALLALAATAYLGTWQKGRAEEKRALQAEYERRIDEPPVELDAASRAESLRFRRAIARGHWHPAGPVFIDNRVFQGRAGFQVWMPLALDRGGIVLVDRGWVARDASYPKPPAIPEVRAAAAIAGVLGAPTGRFIELSGDAQRGNVWQNLTVERYRGATGLEVLPFVLVEEHAAPGFAAVAERPDARADKHVEYMWTWYSLCGTVFALWLLMNFKRGEGEEKSP
jgi:surfeit locus 1 family protein